MQITSEKALTAKNLYDALRHHKRVHYPAPGVTRTPRERIEAQSNLRFQLDRWAESWEDYLASGEVWEDIDE